MTLDVVVTDSDLGDDELEADVLGPEFRVRYCQAGTADEVIAAAADAHGLLVQWAPIDSRVLRSLPRLKAVVRFGVGLDNVDLKAAAELGVQVANVPDYCIDEVAGHACAMIVASSRRLADYSAATRRGDWSPGVAATPVPAEADPVGLVGFGRIGQATAAKLHTLGYPVHVYDPAPDAADAGCIPGVRRESSLLDLAAAVNHLSLHLPATSATTGICNADVFAALGPAGHLVNTSRGALVDEAALLQSLDDGVIRWASLDVLHTEPPISGTSRQLARHPKVTCTPHVAYLSSDSGSRLRRIAARRLAELLTDVTPG